MDKKAFSHHIVIGDFNARNGVRNINENMKCTGPPGTGNRNERGERLLDFDKENNLVETNSLFLKAANMYWTWEAPGGVVKNQIYSILFSERKIVKNCEVIAKVDIGNDNRMVRARVEMHEKLIRLRKLKQTQIRPYSIRKISHSLQNKIEKQI